MQKEKSRSGYQYLNNDFWDLIATRKIYRIPQLLYIYLRGRYCKYGPEFSWADVEAIRLLGVSRSTLMRAKKYLRERGLIVYKSGVGKKWTDYKMLNSVLLPDLIRPRVVKMTSQSRQNDELESSKMTLPIYRVINKVKNKASVSLNKKKFKKYNPDSKASIKHKNRLKEILGN